MSNPPYTFDAPDADVILRAPIRPGSDEFKDFHVHKLILSLASIVFRDTFSIPQPPRHTLEDTTLDVVKVDEAAKVLETFLQLVYPVDPPLVDDLWLVDDLLQFADKYIANSVRMKLKTLLVSPSFLKADPIGVFAVACRSNLDEEAKLAISRTLSFDIVNRISEEHLNVMTTRTYHRLLKEHKSLQAQLDSYRNF